MPNHVSHRITFDSKHADKVFSEILSFDEETQTRYLDFKTLIPPPPQVYWANISSEEEKDFPCNWYSWCRENWGTKWNAYETEFQVIEEQHIAILRFKTAWSIPYPIIAAFMNKFNIPFTFDYCEEVPNFWGMEVYGFPTESWNDKTRIKRLKKEYMLEEHEAILYKELCGRDLESREAELNEE